MDLLTTTHDVAYHYMPAVEEDVVVEVVEAVVVVCMRVRVRWCCPP